MERYLKNSSFLDCVSRPTQSVIWRDILRGQPLLKRGIITGIGDGKSTSLRYHHWVGQEPIYKQIQTDIPESVSHLYVCDIIKGGKWNLDRIRHLLPQHIITDILATPLAVHSVNHDYLRWTKSEDGRFNVKSAYFLALNPNLPIPTPYYSISWKTMWKIPVPFKYRMLMWNCAHRILPVAKSLSLYISTISPVCVRCFESQEDHLHLFRDCWESSILWNYIFQRLGTNEKLSLSTFFTQTGMIGLIITLLSV